MQPATGAGKRDEDDGMPTWGPGPKTVKRALAVALAAAITAGCASIEPEPCEDNATTATDSGEATPEAGEHACSGRDDSLQTTDEAPFSGILPWLLKAW